MMTFADDADDDLVLRSSGVSTDYRLPPGRATVTRTWILVVSGILMFLAGLACGATAMRLAPQSKQTMSWTDLLDRVAQRMRRELDLTEPQQASIEQVVRAHQPELNRIRARTIGEMRVELQQVIEEMSVLLNPEQARRFRAEVQPRLDQYFPADGGQSGAQPTLK